MVCRDCTFNIVSTGIISPCVSRVLKYPQKALKHLITFFKSSWWGNCRNMQEIWFSQYLFEGRPKQVKRLLLEGLSYLTVSSKSHREISISSIFLYENIVKWYENCSKEKVTYFILAKSIIQFGNSIASLHKPTFRIRKSYIFLGRSPRYIVTIE